MPIGITDWMSGIGNLASGVGVLIGVVLTARQFSIWREQALTHKKSTLAEDVLSAAYDVSDVLEYVRSAFESVPREEISNKMYTLQAKMKRLHEHHTAFDALRRHQIRAKFVIGDESVDQAIQELFKARQSVWAALSTLAEYVDDPPQDNEGREFVVKLRSEIYAKYSANDEISKNVENAIRALRERLGPLVQLSSKSA